MEEAPGEKLAYWLGQAAKAAREQAGVKRARVAVELDREVETIDRFELGRSWPQQLEKVLATYARLAGIDDPREIVAHAIELWYEHGSPPRDGDNSSGGMP